MKHNIFYGILLVVICVLTYISLDNYNSKVILGAEISDYESTIHNKEMYHVDELIKLHKDCTYNYLFIFELDSVYGYDHVVRNVNFHKSEVLRLYNVKEELIRAKYLFSNEGKDN